MYHRTLRRAIAAISLIALGMMALVPGAAADQVYHTDKIAFEPVGNAPLRDGWVVNIHPNGPEVYAHEVYTLKGAEPNTEYQITLLVHIQDTDCSEIPQVVFPTAILTTNGAGNGKASIKLTPKDAAGLRNATHGVAWTAATTSNGEVAYATGCSAVVLD